MAHTLHNRPHAIRTRRATLACLACGAASLGGCLTPAQPEANEPRLGESVITPASFARADAPRPLAEAQRLDPAPGPAGSAAGPPRATERQAVATPTPPATRPGGDAPLLTITAGEPVFADEPGEPAGPPTLLEEKVGDINGRPILARRFLEPLSGRLLAQAERLDPQQWQGFAAQLIRQQLRSLVTDELLRAEAIDRLNEQQRAGLRAFLQQVSDQLQSQNLGSRQLAARRLQEEQGLTEQEFIERRRESALIQLTINEEISSRVTVSWRDIVRRYQRESDRWNPDPVAVLRIVRVRTQDTDAAREAAESTQAIEDFIGFAQSDANSFLPDQGGRTEVAIAGEYAETELFPNETLNAAARGLEPSEVAGPIELGPFSYWIGLERIRRESTPLYDAQLTIEQAIEAERQESELDSYIDTLIERARVGSLDQIGERLLDAAQRWYGPRREARRLGEPQR